MKSLNEKCQTLPDTDLLDHVQMRNSSSALDYDRVCESMVAAKDEIAERTGRMLARVGRNGRD